MIIFRNIILTAFIFIVSIASLSAQSKREITDIKPFKKINLASGINLILNKSDKSSIIIEGERTVISKVVCSFNDSVLSIYTLKFNYKSNKRINIYLSYGQDCSLSTINTTSGNRIRCESAYNCDCLELNVRNGSDVFFNVNANSTKIRATSGSKVQLVGISTNADFYAENSCEIHAYKLQCNNVSATATVASHMYVNSKENLSVWATYDSEVLYKGDPPSPQIRSTNGSRVLAQ